MTQVAVIHSAFEETPRTVAFVEVGDRTVEDALEFAFRCSQPPLHTQHTIPLLSCSKA